MVIQLRERFLEHFNLYLFYLVPRSVIFRFREIYVPLLVILPSYVLLDPARATATVAVQGAGVGLGLSTLPIA
jgi:hypothetical protein